MAAVSYQVHCDGIDWAALKATLVEDDFDNERTPQEYEASFRNSHSVCVALSEGRIVGTARALSDGVCNAYIVDVWTHSSLRRQGIATRMMGLLLGRLQGQHVYLFTDDQVEFYRGLGFRPQAIGMSLVVGSWLGH
jgi:ribosomal protein S18 acetylase RimI-like enzyme